jgi:alkaline phosphatase
MKNLIVIIIVSLFLSACNGPVADRYGSSGNKPDAPKNIILMIGDGMGPIQLQAGMLAHGDKLNIEKAQYAAYMSTTSANRLITDSGAAGTALATGQKTNNGAISVDITGNSIPTVLEIAAQNGYATGVVAACAITHATPASFFAHQPNRSMQEEIALDLVHSGVDVFIGGGREFFNAREDGLNLLDSLIARNYHIGKDMADAKNAGDKKLGLLVTEGHPPSYLGGRGDFLPDATEAAINHLSKSEKGFFLMVEASQIDWFGHSNSKDTIIGEMLDFDRAIGKAIEFAERDGNTLVIITSDHETGGMTIMGGNGPEDDFEVHFSSKGHTPALVPVFSFGPRAELFTGIIDNTDIFPKILEAWGINEKEGADIAIRR